jgi:hypothetical protein
MAWANSIFSGAIKKFGGFLWHSKITFATSIFAEE